MPRWPAKDTQQTDFGAVAQSDLGASQSINIMDGVHIPTNVNVLKATGVPSADVQQPWRRRGLLESNTPNPREGFVQKWVRTLDVEGRPDPMNVQLALTEGWRPRNAETISDGKQYASVKDATFGDVLTVMGNVLMERSIEQERQYRKQIEMETNRRTQAIYQNQFDGTESKYAGTRYEQQRQTSVGGRVAPVDD